MDGIRCPFFIGDPANRLTSVNGQAVQWDDNGREAPLGRRFMPPERGNMLADGQAVYTYNTANKLVGVTKGTSSIVYAYSGLGDQLKQIADSVTTDFSTFVHKITPIAPLTKFKGATGVQWRWILSNIWTHQTRIVPYLCINQTHHHHIHT